MLATAGLVALAAGIYERAILRIGAPVRLHRLIKTGRRQADVAAGPPQTDAAARARRTRLFDAAGRAVAVISLLAGVAIGLEHPVAIVLLALGLLLVVAFETHKHSWRGGGR